MKSTPTRGSTCCEPSLALRARIAAAALCPRSIPYVFASPSQIWPRSSASRESKLAACEGKSATSVSCAAWAIAAFMEVRKGDRKSTRLNSSHLVISYAVFCLKKKKQRLIAAERDIDQTRQRQS